MSASRTGRSTGKPRSQPSQTRADEQRSPPAGGAWPNVVIRASAGTGKTFQLSNRYLQLVGAGVRPESILAATFARKAAGEILARVMQRLAGAALDEDACRALAEQVGWTLDRAACGRLLGELLHNLHRLRIGTLDSFFVRLAGSFTLELGLPSDWRIVEAIDDGRWRLEAIRRVLAAGKTSEMLALVHLLFKGETPRSISEQISTLVTNLYDIYCETDEPAWHRLRRPPRLQIEELAAAIESLAAAQRPANGHHANALRDDIVRARSDDWEVFIAKGLAETGLRREGFQQQSRSSPTWQSFISRCSTMPPACWSARSSIRPRRRSNCSAGLPNISADQTRAGRAAVRRRAAAVGRGDRRGDVAKRLVAARRLDLASAGRRVSGHFAGPVAGVAAAGDGLLPAGGRTKLLFGRRREAGDLSLARRRVADF